MSITRSKSSAFTLFAISGVAWWRHTVLLSNYRVAQSKPLLCHHLLLPITSRTVWKRWPIFKIISVLDSALNLETSSRFVFRHTLIVILTLPRQIVVSKLRKPEPCSQSITIYLTRWCSLTSSQLRCDRILNVWYLMFDTQISLQSILSTFGL